MLANSLFLLFLIEDKNYRFEEIALQDWKQPENDILITRNL